MLTLVGQHVILLYRRAPLLCVFSVSILIAQSEIQNAVAVNFSYSSTGVARLLNGPLGFRMNTPPGSAGLIVRADVFPVESSAALAIRCGQDVAGTASNPTADWSTSTREGSRMLLLASWPSTSVPATCFIALAQRTPGRPLFGRVAAAATEYGAGMRIDVPGSAQVYLAGQPDGVELFPNVSSPGNSPVQVP